MPMKYKQAAQKVKPALLSPPNAYLEDVFTSNDAEKPISGGFYRLEAGKELVYQYTYDEMKIILEGEFTITDDTGYSVTAKPGDVFYFDKGRTVTFTTPSYGLAFYTGQRPKHVPA